MKHVKDKKGNESNKNKNRMGGMNWIECKHCGEMNEKIKNVKTKEYDLE